MSDKTLLDYIAETEAVTIRHDGSQVLDLESVLDAVIDGGDINLILHITNKSTRRRLLGTDRFG